MIDRTDGYVEPVLALLDEAFKTGVGVAFIPDPDGWEIVHIGTDWPAISEGRHDTGRLAYAYDLETAARAAIRPHAQLGRWFVEYIAETAERNASLNVNRARS